MTLQISTGDQRFPSDPIVSMMSDMLAMQNSLNIKFVGPDWPVVANKREVVDYGTAILEEAQELQACDLSWKWWKTGHPAPDMDNMRIELVDLLHFVMSDALATSYVQIAEGELGDETKENDLMAITIGDMAFSMQEGWETAYFGPNDILANVTEVKAPAYNALLTRRALHALLASALQGVNQFSAGLDEDDIGFAELDSLVEEDDSGNEFQSMSSINWTAFWSVAYHIGMSLGEVYSTYMGKAVLNSFRIASGDKAGSYHRLWHGGAQDNYFLMEYYNAFFKENGLYPSVEQTTNWLRSAYDEFLATLPKEVTSS